MTSSVSESPAGRRHTGEGELLDRVGLALSEIESFKKEWAAEPAQVARLRLGAIYARARLEKRVGARAGRAAR